MAESSWKYNRDEPRWTKSVSGILLRVWRLVWHEEMRDKKQKTSKKSEIKQAAEMTSRN